LKKTLWSNPDQNLFVEPNSRSKQSQNIAHKKTQAKYQRDTAKEEMHPGRLPSGVPIGEGMKGDGTGYYDAEPVNQIFGH